jgi:1-acyl-sn-glycerol-3-phosphate acyltransferase
VPPLYWFIKFILLGPFVHTVFRPRIVGIENVPEEGPVIFASNHLSFADSMFLPLVVDRHIVFLAKSEYFTGAGIKGWFNRIFFRGVGQVPIDRSGGKASEASLEAGLGVLGVGKQLGIYPEGTRSPDGRLYRGRTGVARLILEAGVTVVPVAMIDTDKVMPLGSKMPRVRRIGVVFGEPLDFSRFAGMEGDRFVLRSITDEIMYELSRISGQEYVDVYASSVKSRRSAPRQRDRAAA